MENYLDRINMVKQYGVTVSDYAIRNYEFGTLRTLCVMKSMKKKHRKELKKYIKNRVKDIDSINKFIYLGLTVSERHKNSWFPFGNYDWYLSVIKDIKNDEN